MSINNIKINENHIFQNNNIPRINSGMNNSERNNEPNLIRNNSDLPLIKLKNQSNNCNINKKKFSIKRIVFNPISFDYQKRLKKLLLFPSTSLSKNRNNSSLDLKLLYKRKLHPLNLNKSEIKNDSNTSRRSMKKSICIESTNNNNNEENSIQQNNNFLKLKIINLLSKYKYESNKDIKMNNKNKFITNNKHIQEFKKSIEDLYNSIGENQKQYLNNINFVHCFLYNNFRNKYQNRNSLLHKNSLSKSAEKSSYSIKIENEINPKYEYIDYFGKENKIITRLTTNNKNISMEKIQSYELNNDKNNNNEINNKLKLNYQLRVPKLIALRDTDEYKNKNFIKFLEKKKANEKIFKEEKIKKNNEMNIIEVSKKGYEKLKNDKIKNFSNLISNTIKQHNSVIKRLDNIIELDKQNYIKKYSEYGINDLNIKENDIKNENN